MTDETDAIFHVGLYRDRRGRQWVYMDYNTWISFGESGDAKLADNQQMRRMIERDQHQDTTWELSKRAGQ